MKTHQQQRYICHKQAYGNRQQDNAEELADNINSALTEKTLHASRHADNKIHPYHIQHQRNDDVDTGILGTQREQRGECSGSRQ